MLSAHTSPQPKRHLDRFSRLCTGPRSVSILYNGLPLPMLAYGPHLIGGSLGLPESGTQMATWSFQPFLQGLKSEVVDDVRAKVDFWGKKTPYGQILTNVFRSDSWRHKSTSCVQISWNLADRKSVKSRVAYLTKKNKKKFRLALALSLLRGSRPKSVRAISIQYTRSAPNFIQIRALPAEL